ncbi:MAG: YMGG-like glycine zipper-containing protein [Desulfuromonadales bacterium]|nr:YMGG-like glycine zipper-containing protein [Desulfuromonadales bacterium]
MKKATGIILALGMALTMAQTVMAKEMVIYPNQGQSDEQMEKDRFECYSWAKKQSGFDPMALPTASEPPPEQEAKQGGAVSGAARGALLGSAIGAITGDSKSDTRTGAKAGAAGGALVGGMRRNDQARSEAQKQQQWEQEQVQKYAAGRNEYNRGFAACMEGKNYTVR